MVRAPFRGRLFSHLFQEVSSERLDSGSPRCRDPTGRPAKHINKSILSNPYHCKHTTPHLKYLELYKYSKALWQSDSYQISPNGKFSNSSRSVFRESISGRVRRSNLELSACAAWYTSRSFLPNSRLLNLGGRVGWRRLSASLFCLRPRLGRLQLLVSLIS